MKKARQRQRQPGAAISNDELFEIFESYQEAVEVLGLLPKLLKDRFGRTKDTANSGYGFFGIEHLRVQFTSAVENVEINNSYASNQATILAPVLSGESKSEQDKRRRALLAFFMPCMPASQERATSQFYELIKRSGRKQLMKILRKKYGRNKQGSSQ